MSQPVWEKITPDGKPFGYKSENEIELEKKVEELNKKIELVEKENKQLRSLFEKQKQK